MRGELQTARMMAVLLALAGSTLAARAHEFRAGGLLIAHPWARATPNGAQVGGGYFVITNTGSEADTLTGGTGEIASGFTIHDMTTEDGVTRMHALANVPIPPGGSVAFTPAGRHIMFTGLKHGLRKGDRFTGTLVFAKAGTVPVTFVVEGLGDKGPGEIQDHDMPGMKMP